MDRSTRMRGLWRWVAVAAVGVLAGSLLLHPALAALPTSFKKLVKRLEKKLDPRYVNEGQVFTRHASCPGLNFYPANNDTLYANDGIVQYQPSGAGPTPFRCALHLPDGAEVTSARFTVKDEDPSPVYNVTNCVVQRFRIAPPTAPSSFEHMAGPLSTANATEGYVGLTDPTIQFPVVDNASFAYEAECQLHAGNLLGIYGVSVEYTITGANG